MAWLQDNGDENEFSQFEEDEAGDKEDEGLLEAEEEEVTITERPAAGGTPAAAPKPKARRPARRPARPAARGGRKASRSKAASKKKTSAKGAKKSSKKGGARKSSRSRRKR